MWQAPARSTSLETQQIVYTVERLKYHKEHAAQGNSLGFPRE